MSDPCEPLEAWIAWYDDLGPEIARELAFLLMRTYPGGVLQPTIITEDASQGFVPRLRRLGASALERVGLATLLSGLTDLIIAERSDPKSWSQTDALLGVLDEASAIVQPGDAPFAEAIGSFTEHARARAPLRQRQWAKTADSWREARCGPISPDALLRSYRAARIPSPGDGSPLS